MEMAPDFRARICKSLWRPEIYSKESIPPAFVVWRAGAINRVVVPARQGGNRFLKRFTNTGSVLGFAGSSPARVVSCEPNVNA